MNQTLFARIRTFLSSYMTFPDPAFADICTLWAMGTHVYKRFDSFGYLVITAATKRAGKSVLGELLSMVCHDAKMGTSMTPSVMRSLVAKGSTMIFDEAESLNSEAASAMREYLNVGYRAGQMIYIRAGFDDIVPFPAYGPKCFILIGDVNDTLRDRSINLELVRSKAPRIYRNSEARREAIILQGASDPDNGDSELTHAIDNAYAGEIVDAYDVEILQGREGEVWTVIFSLAKAFCPDRLDAIISCAVNLASIKMTTEKKDFRTIRENAENTKTDDMFMRMAMRDLASVLHRGETKLYSAVAIERMKAIGTSPWRTFRGTGLDQQALSDLLSTLCKTRDVKIHGKCKRGYQRTDILAGLKRMGETS